MDVTEYRLDRCEKRADAADARMARIEDTLDAMQVTLAGLATKDDVSGLLTKDALRDWGLILMAATIGTGIASTLSVVAVMFSVAGQFTASAANQLAAFQAGLSTIQAVVAAHDARPVAPAPGGQPDKPSAAPPAAITGARLMDGITSG